MFKTLFLLLITNLCWKYSCSRHIGSHSYYGPYPDYSYRYSGFGPSYHQQHPPPYFSPPATYYDQRHNILRPFPGGGVPVLVDYHKRCSNHYVGLKAHPDELQYYYVCKPDCVIFGKCQNLQIFNASSGQCVQHPPPEYKPTCKSVGRFPIISDCHLYYKCENDLQTKIYSCPGSMVFSPTSKKCINGYKCIPTQISPHSSYLPKISTTKFPPCFENGVFRSPSDCALYYKCELSSNAVYMQTRLRCPQGDFFDLQKKKCLPANIVPCDCIQEAELVYPKTITMPFERAIYPAQFQLESLEEGNYPVEQMPEDLNNNNKTNDPKNYANVNRAVATTLPTTALETTVNNEMLAPNDIETAVLSDYIDIRDNIASNNHKQLESLHKNSGISEKTASTEAPSEERAIVGMINIVQANEGSLVETVTIKNFNTETIKEPNDLIEDTVNTSTVDPLTESTEMETTNFKEIETRTTLKGFEQNSEKTGAGLPTHRNEIKIITSVREELAPTASTLIGTKDFEVINTTGKTEKEEDTTTANISTHSIKIQPCENLIEIVKKNNSDRFIHTQNKNCLNKLSSTNLNTDDKSIDTTNISKNRADSMNTLHEQHSKIITTINPNSTIDQLPTANLTSTQQPTGTPVSKNNELEIRSTPELDTTTTAISYATTLTTDLIPRNNKILLTRTKKNLNDSKDEKEIEYKATTKTEENFDQHDYLAIDGDSKLFDLEDVTSITDFERGELIYDELHVDTADFEDRFRDGFATTAATINSGISLEKQPFKNAESVEMETEIKIRETAQFMAVQPTTLTTSVQTNIPAVVSAMSPTELHNEQFKKKENAKHEVPLAVPENIKEVRNNTMLPAELIQTTTASNQQHLSHTHFTTSTYTQMSNASTNTRDPSEKQANNLIIFIRKENHKLPSLDSPTNQNLYYTLKTKPVINNSNDNKSNKTVTVGPRSFSSTNVNVPRLDIVVEKPIDVHLSICPTACDKNHTHASPAGKRAVLLKWFANKSKQTLGFETTNEASAEAD